MKVNTITEFYSFINELDLQCSYTKDFLYTKNFLFNIFINKDRDFFIMDLEKRKVIQISQTLSLDGVWIRHIDETTFYELDIEIYSNNKINIKVLTFKTLEDLQKVEQFIKDNFKFMKKGGKICF